ncbi:Mth938-like domain-containing protein [Uliginosibacterium sp. 31-16]|uniref:Mth938-like domain-containing protein n=1 Tax=Uliginosibacterium sp. 31-16 TaxID=3068315 RepID=UPI00273D8C33|nr:Mth938-like domain-containing protein [Uliginosibacterium sp. 31-16]MDP5237910.1 Mth938-like domain-containing protein [Uliginosibacterium sp. 31-16]
MKLNREISSNLLLIASYDAGSFTLDGKRHESSLIVTPETVQAWPVRGFAALTAQSLDAVCALKPALVLIGTGTRQHFPAPAVLRPLIEARIGFEIMDTGSACRTYNLLAGEGRSVAAALLLDA